MRPNVVCILYWKKYDTTYIQKYCLFQNHSRFVSLVGEITSQAEAFMGRKAVGCYKLVAVTKIYGLFGKLVLNQFYVRKIELQFIYINYFGLYTFDFILFWCVLQLFIFELKKITFLVH